MYHEHRLLRRSIAHMVNTPYTSAKTGFVPKAVVKTDRLGGGRVK